MNSKHQHYTSKVQLNPPISHTLASLILNLAATLNTKISFEGSMISNGLMELQGSFVPSFLPEILPCIARAFHSRCCDAD